MAVDSVNGSSFLRITGLASGLDTDSLIKQLMSAEKIPLNKLYQKNRVLEWKKNDYRDITNLFRGFYSDFFDILGKNNMTSVSAYKKFNVASSDPSVVTATANAEAIETPHSLTQVTSLAKSASISSSTGIILDVASSAAANTNFSGGNQFNITLNGIVRTVAVQAIDYTATYGAGNDYIQLKTDLQNAVNAAFGAGKITVTESAGKFSFSAANSKIILSNASTNNGLVNLNITSGSTNRINLNSTLATIATQLPGLNFDGSGNLVFKINNQQFSFNKDTKTLNDVISGVNSNSSAGVTMQYSEVTGKFTLTAKQKGAGESLVIENIGGTLFGAGSAINIDSVGNLTSVSNGKVTQGADASFTLDGVTLTRSDNTFDINGVTYTLNSLFNETNDPTKKVTVTPTKDVDTVFNNVKAFVDKYNEVIGKINDKLTEKVYRGFQPLTDEQKAAMKDDDIKKWEEKAKSGLLRSDELMRSAVDKMRRAIYDSISGVSGIVADIGISTTYNYLDNGKLMIDETKLKDAIRNNPDKVMNLFSKTSTSVPSYSATLTAAVRSIRYNEEGIAFRLADIIQDNIRTSKDNNGKKGFLLEKAGVAGDTSEFLNLIDKDITTNSKQINNLLDRLNDKETMYYRKFTALERYISQMNSQSNWVLQQFGGSK